MTLRSKQQDGFEKKRAMILKLRRYKADSSS